MTTAAAEKQFLPDRPAPVVAVGNLGGDGPAGGALAGELAGVLESAGIRVALVAGVGGGPPGRPSPAPSRTSPLHLPLLRVEDARGWIGALQGLRGGHDVVVIDLPADGGPAAAAALLTASLVVLPYPAGDAAAAAAARRMMRHVHLARAERVGDPLPVLIVPDHDAAPEEVRSAAGYASQVAGLGEDLAGPMRLGAGSSRPWAELATLAAHVRARLLDRGLARAARLLLAPGRSALTGADERPLPLPSIAAATGPRMATRPRAAAAPAPLKVIYFDDDAGRGSRLRDGLARLGLARDAAARHLLGREPRRPVPARPAAPPVAAMGAGRMALRPTSSAIS